MSRNNFEARGPRRGRQLPQQRAVHAENVGNARGVPQLGLALPLLFDIMPSPASIRLSSFSPSSHSSLEFCVRACVPTLKSSARECNYCSSCCWLTRHRRCSLLLISSSLRQALAISEFREVFASLPSEKATNKELGRKRTRWRTTECTITFVLFSPSETGGEDCFELASLKIFIPALESHKSSQVGPRQYWSMCCRGRQSARRKRG